MAPLKRNERQHKSSSQSGTGQRERTHEIPPLPLAGHRRPSGAMAEPLSFECGLLPTFLSFQSNAANVIFHERFSIYQGQWHAEAAEECRTPLDLYNERWESETHSEVVSSCAKEAPMIYSAAESRCFREI